MSHSRRLVTCSKLCFELYFTPWLDRWVIILRNQKLCQQQNGYHSECTERTQVTLVFHSAQLKVVRSTWPRSVTAPVKLWLSTSAARRMCVPIHVGLFREWKTTTLSWSLSVRVGIMTENGDLMEAMWNWGCTDLPHAFHSNIKNP